MVSRTSNEPTSQPKTIANRYRLEETIGQGGMATVFRAHDLTQNKAVALKWLSLAPKDDPGRDTTRFFEYEFHTLSQLAHPRVARPDSAAPTNPASAAADRNRPVSEKRPVTRDGSPRSHVSRR